jgi:hypothetical protein
MMPVAMGNYGKLLKILKSQVHRVEDGKPVNIQDDRGMEGRDASELLIRQSDWIGAVLWTLL